MHVYVNPDLFHLAGATTSDPCRGGDDVPKKVRVFGLKHLFLKRFTVRSTTRTLITDKNGDHSAFTAIWQRINACTKTYEWSSVSHRQYTYSGESGRRTYSHQLNITRETVLSRTREKLS